MLVLREAREDDEARLLRWRNESSTREVSLTREEISADAHHAWFIRRLGDPHCRLLIIEEWGRPIGQIRLDLAACGVAYVSISLAEGERGRGLGREALRVACSEARGGGMGSELRALVRKENRASLSLFDALDFRPVSERDGVIELAASLTR